MIEFAGQLSPFDPSCFSSAKNHVVAESENDFSWHPCECSRCWQSFSRDTSADFRWKRRLRMNNLPRGIKQNAWWRRRKYRAEFAAFPACFYTEAQTKTAAIYVYACLSGISWHKYLLGSLEFRFSFFTCPDENDALVPLLKRPRHRQRRSETFGFPEEL